MNTRRRILLVSFFYGNAGATGGFRWAAMLPAALEDGWTATVVTANAVDGATPDARREVLRVADNALAVRTLARLASAKRAALGVVRSWLKSIQRLGRRDHSDGAQASSWPSSIDELRSLIEKLSVGRDAYQMKIGKNIQLLCEIADQLLWSIKARNAVLRHSRGSGTSWDIIVVSSPPHYTQFCGALLSKALRVPFVADFRDPWAAALPQKILEKSLGRRLDLRAEKHINSCASVVVYNTPVAQEIALAALGKSASSKSVVVANGYDSSRWFQGSTDTDCFRILVAGHIYPTMDVRVVFAAMESLVKREDWSASQLNLELLGSGTEFHGIPYTAMAQAYGIENYLTVSPRTARAEAIERQSKAAVLVAMDYPQPSAVVMKAYDYLCVPGFMLPITTKGSALWSMMQQLNLPVFEYSQQSEIAEFLLKCAEDWRRMRLPIHKDPNLLYHRAAQTQKILSTLDEEVSRARTVQQNS